jgi:predicted nuclease with RNAse H fold
MPVRVAIVLRGEIPKGGLTVGDRDRACGILPGFLTRFPTGQRFAFALRHDLRLPSEAYQLQGCPLSYAPIGKVRLDEEEWFSRRYSEEEIRLLAAGKLDQVETESSRRKRLEEPPSPVPIVALDRPLRIYDGGSLKLRDLAGQVVVFAEWSMDCDPEEDCGPLAELVKLHRQHRSAPLRIVGMPFLHPFDPSTAIHLARAFAKANGIEFPLVWPDGDFTYAIAENKRLGSVAASAAQYFVISAEGRIVKRVRGENGTAAVLRQAVETALAAARPAKSR